MYYTPHTPFIAYSCRQLTIPLPGRKAQSSPELYSRVTTHAWAPPRAVSDAESTDSAALIPLHSGEYHCACAWIVGIGGQWSQTPTRLCIAIGRDSQAGGATPPIPTLLPSTTTPSPAPLDQGEPLPPPSPLPGSIQPPWSPIVTPFLPAPEKPSL